MSPQRAEYNARGGSRRAWVRFPLASPFGAFGGGDELATAVDGFVEPDLAEDDERTETRRLVVGLDRKVTASLGRMEEADLAVFAVLARETTLRHKRKAVTRKLAGALVGLRRTTLGQHLAPDLTGLALQPLVARDPTSVLRRAEAVDQQFRAANVDDMLGPARFQKPSDLRDHAAQIRPLADELRHVVLELDLAARETQSARARRLLAMDGAVVERVEQGRQVALFPAEVGKSADSW